MRFRTALLAVALLVSPLAARADYVDVITNKLLPGCSLGQYLGLVDEFRALMKAQKYNYRVETIVPFSGPALNEIYWVGRTANLAEFGQESERWEIAVAKPGTPENAWNTKSLACSETLRRTGGITR